MLIQNFKKELNQIHHFLINSLLTHFEFVHIYLFLLANSDYLDFFISYINFLLLPIYEFNFGILSFISEQFFELKLFILNIL